MSTGCGGLLLGIDVGSTTVKVVAADAAAGAVVWRDYERHESRPDEKLLDMLGRAERGAGVQPGRARAVVTGSAGATLAEAIGARYVQEVAALALAVEERNACARTAIELGGQDAKIVIFEPGEGGRTRKIVSMNDKCAGGTGVVIDKIAAKLELGSGALRSLSTHGLRLYPVAGKCGVFAETDINGLQKKGVPPADLLASLLDAIVVQDLSVLSRGRTLRPTVLLLGGPHAFIPALRETWLARLPPVWEERGVTLPPGTGAGEAIVVPEDAEFYPALGAIAFGRRHLDGGAYLGAARLAAVLDRGRGFAVRKGAPAVAAAGMPLAEFRSRFERPSWTPPPLDAGCTVRGYVGLDAGSTSTKAALLDESGTVLAKAYQLSRGNPIEDAVAMFRALRAQLEARGAQADVAGVVTTGYAKDILKETFSADAALVETVAHAQSALHFYRDPHVIVDVGGQDIKIIVLRDGRVKDFRLNTQCSAGNGYFLQAIARSFGYAVEDFAEAAFMAREMPVFGQGCVLFLQTEIADVLRRGWRPPEILAGLAAVLPRNVFLYVAKAPNLARFGTRFVLQGGTQRNLAAVKAQVDFIRDSFRGQATAPEIILHDHCGEAGAIGAALEAIRLCRAGRETTFVGLDAAEHVTFSTRSDETTRCRFCTNECARTFVDVAVGASACPPGVAGPDASRAARPSHPVPDRRFIVAGCEKGAAEDVDRMRAIKAAVDLVRAGTPNLVAFAAREAWKPPRVPLAADPLPSRAWSPAARGRRALMERRDRLRVGIPRVFNMYAYAPLFAGYLGSLGVRPPHIVYSDVTSTEMFRTGAGRGSIDPCFPSKVALAHVHNLLFAKHQRQPLHCIFFPMLDVLPSRVTGVVASNACPTVMLTPQTVRAAFTRDSDLFADAGVAYLLPLLNLDDRRLLRRQMFETWDPLLGLSWEENERALDAGFAALAAFEAAVGREARRALDGLERDQRLGIVLLGRPYHHDPGLNHGIPDELQKLGYPVFSQSTLPADPDLLARLFGDDVRAGAIGDPMDISDVWKVSVAASSNLKLWAAKFAARHPNLVAVELSNFKCGHDAPIYSTVEEIIEASGTPYFGFKDIDENRPEGAIRLRLETIDYSLKRLRETLLARRRRAERIERWLKDYERKLREELGSRAAATATAG
jgi:activator of 2-hydroxyglutaryl-CoA dehydratase/predicted nucleotide-binding protein (sugar kinase/HSP70/actin superfamily)